MKKIVWLACAVVGLIGSASARESKGVKTPAIVKEALSKKYPNAKKVTWETEKGNFEANWGGKSGEDTSVMFTPSGKFVEEVDAIAVSRLPASVFDYVKKHYKGTKVKEAGRITDAVGKKMFEAEIKGKDLVFDENGKFLKID